MLKLRYLFITFLWPRRYGLFLKVKNSLLLTRTMPNKILYTSNMSVRSLFTYYAVSGRLSSAFRLYIVYIHMSVHTYTYTYM